MNLATLLEKIDLLYEKIIVIEQDTIHALLQEEGIEPSAHISQEHFDFSFLYEDLKQILYPMLEFYHEVIKSEKVEKAKKVYFIALCEMIKKDYTTGMIKTFRAVTDKSYIDTNRYYRLLESVTESQGISVKKKDNIRLFERTYIEETGIPQNLTRTVIKFFKSYWRYFRHIDVKTRIAIISDYIEGKDFPEEFIFYAGDERILSNAQKELMDFPEKSIRTIKKLDEIFVALDEYDELCDPEIKSNFVEEISNKVGFNILNVLRNSDLEDVYSKYLQSIPIYKFTKMIVPNLPKNEMVTTPEGTTIQAADLRESNICCGIYKIRGISYEVVISPIISLAEMLEIPRNTVRQLAKDYYIYVSNDYFDIDANGRTIEPRRLIFNNKERYVWLDKIPLASSVYVDGHTINSSERLSLSGKISKKYVYESEKSELHYVLHCFKALLPEYRYKKLNYITSSGEKGLLCIGNDKGVFYIEDKCFSINNPSVFELKLLIDDEVIHTELIELKSRYLFDKWTGTEYYSNRKNDKHSGALILFDISKEAPLDMQHISNEYVWNNYVVTEFLYSEKEETLDIYEDHYVFTKGNKPYFIVRGNLDYDYRTESLDSLNFKFYNLNSSYKYWFVAENNKQRERIYVEDATLLLNRCFNEAYLKKSGKWFFSLWENQHKIDEVSVFLEPQLYAEQIDDCTMENHPVKVKVTASENCFASQIGDFVDYTELTIGDAKLNLADSYITAPELENYIYLDSLGIMKKIQLTPNVWGIRVKDSVEPEWHQSKSFNVDLENINKTVCSICSNSNVTIHVNEKKYNVKPGFNNIKLQDFLYLKRRTVELFITDDRQATRITVGCSPKFFLYDTNVEKNLIIVVKYVGPIDEGMLFRIYLDNEPYMQIHRTATKNSFLVHLLLGSVETFNNRRVTVEAKLDNGNLPLKIYSDIIIYEPELSNVVPSVEEAEHVENEKVDFLKLFQDVDLLLERYSTRKDISFNYTDVDMLIGKLLEKHI